MVDPQKVMTIQQQLNPTDSKEPRSFLGLSSYYRLLIPRFAEIPATLHATTSVKRTFAWTPEMQKAFEELKLKLTSPLVLAFLDFEQSFVVETEALSVAVGAMLAQCRNDGNLILFGSRVVR